VDTNLEQTPTSAAAALSFAREGQTAAENTAANIAAAANANFDGKALR
jgi:hypothetical protein